eukprot:scaffold3773_cov115-Pinguiococcus_pyrenoidosus.AAC.1
MEDLDVWASVTAAAAFFPLASWKRLGSGKEVISFAHVGKARAGAEKPADRGRGIFPQKGRQLFQGGA